jgi:hypothetical protein
MDAQNKRPFGLRSINMAFGRKDYTGPVKDRGTVNRGGKKLANVSKEELDAFRNKKGNEG